RPAHEGFDSLFLGLPECQAIRAGLVDPSIVIVQCDGPLPCMSMEVHSSPRMRMARETRGFSLQPFAVTTSSRTICQVPWQLSRVIAATSPRTRRGSGAGAKAVSRITPNRAVSARAIVHLFASPLRTVYRYEPGVIDSKSRE